MGTIAFGAAGHTYYVLNNPANWSDPAAYTKTPHYSSLSRHEANIILNAGAAYNTDTGAVHDFRLNNGVYLDLLNLGYLGVAEVGSGGAWHVNYELNTNLIRLRGRQAIPTYSEFYITNNSTWGTDPNLALGRPITNLSVGITIQGVANTLKLIGNRFTTWPAAGFLMSNPLSTNESLFRLMWPIESYTWYSSQHYSRLRNPAENVTLSANSFSTNAFEFLGATALTDHSGIPSFTSNSAPSYTGLRLALTTPPPGFTPAGKVERVESTWSGTNLTAVKEVAFGQTFITNGNQIAVTLRAVEHKTSASGSSGTVAITNKTVWLAADISPTNGGTNALAMVSATTSSSGIATFNLSLGTHASAWIRLKGWLPPVSGATNLDQTQRAWASHDLNFGTVVQLSATPDVADDKNTSAGKRAVLRFTRTGSSASLSNTLIVSFTLPASGVPELISPVDYRNLIASYGTTGSADYYFGTPVGGSLSSISQGGANTVTFSANSALVEVPIVTRTDNLTEANTIRVDLVASPNYAIGASSRADVLIYDGPLWDLVELSPSDQQQTTLAAAYGLNSGVTDSSGAFTVNPRIVGRYSYYAIPDVNAGGVWKWPQTTLSPLSATFFPQSVSFRSTSNELAWIAGYEGNVAKVVRENGTSWTTLSHLYSGPSAALAISPDSSLVVGFSGNTNGPPRAVYWDWFGSSAPVSLTASSVVSGDGKAYAVNNSGMVVGYMTATIGGTLYSSRPFRTPASLAVDDVGDLLPAPISFSFSNGSGAGNSVSSTNIAVGWVNQAPENPKIATIWDPRSGTGPNPAGSELGAWFPSWQKPTQYNSDSSSEALSLNDPDATGNFQIVGWSNASTNSLLSRAVYKASRYSNWIDLNDRHYVNYPSGWTLRRAVGINNQRMIMGSLINGSGEPRGFVLIPRNPGQ
ncbi:MAG: hypothetical protein J0M24_27720 [Verrucomicrobia bacterium]|nr:hypothetical protein [Verrucomicrobiota bacterium]